MAQGYGSVIIGGSTGKDASHAVAIGPSAVVTAIDGTAVGYQSTTNQSGTIAFGHDTGDVSGYTVTWQQRTDTDSEGNIVKNADGTTNDYTKDPTVTENKYTSSYYNRLVKVADGKSAHDVATVGQTVELVAGDHVKVEADTTATNTIGQQRKKISVLTDGKIEKGNTGLVTGDAINTALSAETTARQDADTTLTNQLTATNKNVSDLQTAIKQKADTSLSNLTDAGKAAVKGIMKDDLAQKVDKSATNLSADDVKNWQDKLGNGNIARGDHGLISGGKVFEALQGVGNYGLVKSDGKVVNIAKDDSATVIDVSGAGTNRVVTGVKTDVRDPSSAANVAYVNGNTQQIYQDMNQAYGSLRNDISRAAASSNALAALKPMEFDSDDKLQFGIGYGHYHNANAAAVGAFYQPDENCMMNLGASLGNGDPGISAGITIKFGPGGSGVPTLSKKQMAQIIQKQSAQLDEQSKEIESLKRANEEMKEQFKAIMEKLNDQH